uniref:Uncharacterized protein n=1 Tax=Cannabis sativa TaxID=3483 RepID=A0A803NIE4_CANSA
MLGEFTKQKECLNFARVMIEVDLIQEFPKDISFVNEWDEEVVVKVVYEGRLILCNHYKSLGHSREDCQKKNIGKSIVKTKWVPKKLEKEPVKVGTMETDQEEVCECFKEIEFQDDDIEQDKRASTNGGGDPLFGNG